MPVALPRICLNISKELPMKSIALVAVSLVFVLQTAPSRAEEICSDGRTIRQQCEHLNAAYLREHQNSELDRADRHCRTIVYAEHARLELAIPA
jgi:hypothetical protein